MEMTRGAEAGRGRSLPVVSEGSVLTESIQKVEVFVLPLLSLQSLRQRPRRPVTFRFNLITFCQRATSELNSEVAAVSVAAFAPFLFPAELC